MGLEEIQECVQDSGKQQPVALKEGSHMGNLPHSLWRRDLERPSPLRVPGDQQRSDFRPGSVYKCPDGTAPSEH